MTSPTNNKVATPTTKSTNSVTKALDESPRDDEGLLFKYDVVLCGTGLVQSILASALARAGKTVLHCDAADYYGELDAVWTLPYLQQQSVYERKEAISTDRDEERFDDPSSSSSSNNNIPLSPKGAFASLRIHSMHTTTAFPVRKGHQVSTPYGMGVYNGPVGVGKNVVGQQHQQHASLSVSLTHWKLADGSHPTVYVGIPTDLVVNDENDNVGITKLTNYLLADKHGIQSLQSQRARQILQEHSRSLALDVTPGLLLAAGASVNALLKSGVADYLDFKSLQGLLWLNKDSFMLERVPCSKNDVFSSTLLSPMDKRRLMKFLQLALDYATTEETKEYEQAAAAQAAAAAAAETTTLEGEDEVRSVNERRLNQGRSLSRPQNKAVSTDGIQLLQQCIAEGMDFETYLTEKQRLSPQLRLLVRYALTLEAGQPGSSSSPSLQEGMKNLCQHMQSLGRFGSTAFLVPVYGSGELPQAFCRSAAVYGATYLLRRAPLGILTSSDNETVRGIILGGDNEDGLAGKPIPKSKQVSCSQVVVPKEALMSKSTRRVLRQISILCGKPIRSDPISTDQRHAVILPPGSFGNSDTIHGLLLDEKVSVAPHVPGGCTVLHLTTTVDDDEQHDAEDVQATTTTFLQEAMDAIVGKDTEGVVEIFRVVFSYPLFETSEQEEAATTAAMGLHTIYRPSPGLAADSAFEQAEEIFGRICPTVEFLTMSEAMDAAVKERAGDTRNEEDDEGMVLESAMGMIDSPPTES